MKTRPCLIAAALLAALPARAGVLTVADVTQEQDQWCWAATSRCVLLYYGVDQSQCAIAEYTRTATTASDVNLGSTNCCTDATRGCDTWNYFWSYGGSIADILVHFAGASVTTYNNPLSLDDLTGTIDAQHLFMLRWQWTDGSGHFLVGHGYQGSSIYYMNPWPGEGLEVGDYDWMVSGSPHTWETSVTVALPIAASCSGQPDGTRCDDGDACTLGDACQGGACVGTAINCPASACSAAGSCDHTTGQCVPGTAQSDGASCDDGDACTESDHCLAGACVGNRKTCAAPDACHVASCDSATGACVTAAAADGTSCPSGTCQSGSCSSTPAKQLPTSTGCSAAGAGAAAWLGLAGLWALRRRRR